MDESEIAHLICDLCFDPQITLPVLKLTILLGECNAVCMHVHIYDTYPHGCIYKVTGSFVLGFDC